MGPSTLAETYATVEAELRELIGASAAVLDAHTHLGADEDGMALDPSALLGFLDDVGPKARAVVFPFHDPERDPGYRLPNDRVLEWAAASGGRLIPYCRLDPEQDPATEAERCLSRGARGIKLHPRAQQFGFEHPAMRSIFSVARDAGVPVLIHAGRGMGPMASLVDLVSAFADVPVVLAHAGIADMGVFAEGLADHPCVVYDTSCFSGADVVELFARVPAERIVFASDVPYGRPVGALFLAMRAAAFAGLDAAERALVAGGTMGSILDGTDPPASSPPRLGRIRPASGALVRIGGYLTGAFSAALGAPVMVPGWIGLARAVCRDPEPGAVGPALARIDGLLAGAQAILSQADGDRRAAMAPIHAALTIAATEPVSV